MPTFRLTAPNLAWVPTAPVVLTNVVKVNATPAQLFDRLSDLGSWSDWCVGMRRVRVDGPAAGVGAVRTVWVGPTRVQERFLEWVPGERLTFALVGSNVPGLTSMVEDWAMAPDPEAPGRSVMTVTIGIEPSGVLRRFPKLLHGLMSKMTKKGQDGIVTLFP
ncbi:MAG TPA: SRPBCC family protein [Acidimicrobiales bacterium]